MTDAELALEAKHGYKVQRSVVPFTDEIEIWGNAGEEFQEVAQMFLDGLGALPR